MRKKILRNKIIKAFIPMFAILGLHIIATIFKLYYYILWLDTPMHLLGGGAVAWTVLILLKIYKKEVRIRKKMKLLDALFAVSTTSLIAVLWEVYEFVSDTFFFTTIQMGIQDTLGDLLMGIIGAGAVGVWYCHKKK